VTEHQRLIAAKLAHLGRMREYLTYSLSQAEPLMPIQNWDSLSPAQHETLAAFRVRFSEFQEHLGKAMRAVAIEEEQRTETFTAVLLYMEKLGILDDVQTWKELRELRNAIKHEYEENAGRLTGFFQELVRSTSTLLDWYARLRTFCAGNYPS